jgi:hypothetical protein
LDGVQYLDGVLRSECRPDSVELADLLPVDVDPDESPDRPCLVAEAVTKSRVPPFEVVQQALYGHRARVDPQSRNELGKHSVEPNGRHGHLRDTDRRTSIKSVRDDGPGREANARKATLPMEVRPL